MFKVNVFGMLNGIWAFGNRMIAQGTPAMILNVNSETGLYVPGPMMGGYAASKHAGPAPRPVRPPPRRAVRSAKCSDWKCPSMCRSALSIRACPV